MRPLKKDICFVYHCKLLEVQLLRLRELVAQWGSIGASLERGNMQRTDMAMLDAIDSLWVCRNVSVMEERENLSCSW